MSIKLTPEEEWLYMPKWRKALITLFMLALPFIASVDSVAF